MKKMALQSVGISGGSSESDLPDSDSVFGINSGADSDVGLRISANFAARKGRSDSLGTYWDVGFI